MPHCRAHAHKIHFLMGLLVFLKALSLVLEGLHLLVISLHGHGALYADIPYYTTLTLKVGMRVPERQRCG